MSVKLEGRQKEVSEKVVELGQNKAAEHFGVPRSTLRDFLYDNNLPTRKVTQPKENESKLVVKPDSVEVTSPSAQSLANPEQIIKDRGLNPDDWDFQGLVDNEWDSPTGETLYQRKLTLRRKNGGELILPARTDGPKFKVPKKKNIKSEGSLFVVKGDEQAPFHDEKLHDKYCTFLADNDVHTIIDVGDGMDLPDISKYKSNPEVEYKARVNNCLTISYELRRDERIAAPDAEIYEMPGNHDIRLRDFILSQVPELHGLKRAQIEGQEEDSIFNIGFLKRLDEIGVKWLETDGPYEHGEFIVSDKLSVRHGHKAVKGAGKTAHKVLEEVGYSTIHGHTHRLGIVYKTTFDIHGEPTILAAAESGCLCDVEKTGLGYNPFPDWQPGLITATVFPDGSFALEPAIWVNGKLLWRNKKY
jgi:hypothetical protein